MSEFWNLYIKPRLSLLAVLVLALLPSAGFYVFVPFFWNNTDSIVYLTMALRYAVPQYPPLYNGICEALMILTQNGPLTIYLLILLQHIVYVVGLIYLASLFKTTRARLIFLSVMAINWNILIAVNGVFPEGLFAGIELFFWGSLFRFLLQTTHRFKSAVVLGTSLFALTLTKHIGQLWFSYPVFVAAALLVANLFKSNYRMKRMAHSLLIITVVSFGVLLVTQQGLMKFLKVSNPLSIGRQGAYRIREMPYKKMNSVAKEALLQNYIAGTSDPMLRPTFEAIFTTQPWGETYYRVDSILKAKHITNRDADDCMNEAFKVYMLHMEHYGFESAMHDLHLSLNMQNVAVSILQVNTLSLFDRNYFPPALQSKWKGQFTQPVYNGCNAFTNGSALYYFSWFSLGQLIMISLLLGFLSLFRLKWQVVLLIVSPVIFAWFLMVVNCIITVFIIRYVLASYMEVYMVMALLLAILGTKKATG